MNHYLGFIGGIGAPELIIILIIALVIFGKNLPKVMRSVGGSVKEFRKGIDEGLEDKDDKAEKAPAQQESAAPGTVARDALSEDGADESKAQERSL